MSFIASHSPVAFKTLLRLKKFKLFCDLPKHSLMFLMCFMRMRLYMNLCIMGSVTINVLDSVCGPVYTVSVKGAVCHFSKDLLTEMYIHNYVFKVYKDLT